jgi:hypothetical protein
MVLECVPRLGRSPFIAAPLIGNRTADGRAGDGTWSTRPMTAFQGTDGNVFRAEVAFAPDQVGTSISRASS